MKVYKSRRAVEMIRSTYDALLAQWGVEVEEMDLPSPYGTTHVIAAGDKAAPPVLLFHGVGDDSALMWLHNAGTLAKKYRIYAVDTVGGPGKSVPGAGYTQGFDDAAWMDTVLDALDISIARLVGTSHGAYLAQYYGVMRPERVEKIVCLAGAPPVGGGSPMATMLRIFLPEALLPTRRNTQRLLRKLCGAHSEVFLDNETVMTHYRWLLRGFNTMAMRYHAVKGMTGEQLDMLRPRTLYLVGNEDPFQRLGGQAAIEENRMRCRRFDRVGHGINHEIAGEINAILLDVL